MRDISSGLSVSKPDRRKNSSTSSRVRNQARPPSMIDSPVKITRNAARSESLRTAESSRSRLRGTAPKADGLALLIKVLGGLCEERGGSSNIVVLAGI